MIKKFVSVLKKYGSYIQDGLMVTLIILCFTVGATQPDDKTYTVAGIAIFVLLILSKFAEAIPSFIARQQKKNNYRNYLLQELNEDDFDIDEPDLDEFNFDDFDLDGSELDEIGNENLQQMIDIFGKQLKQDNLSKVTQIGIKSNLVTENGVKSKYNEKVLKKPARNIKSDNNKVSIRDKKDIIALMLKNNDEINEYFKISKKQAKLSFNFSIFACVLGFVMLGAAVYGIFGIENAQIAIIGTISGAITEVIAGTVLIIHNKSALQLNHYYDALHQNEKFLSAVNMADKLSNENREEMYIEIIRKQIEVSAGDMSNKNTKTITKEDE